MKKLLILAILAGLTACAPTGTNSTTAPTEAAQKTFTMKDYGKIKTGMTVAQAEKATGFKAKETSQNSMEAMGTTITTTGYMIANPDGSSASLVVQNDKITSKMQMGLK